MGYAKCRKFTRSGRGVANLKKSGEGTSRGLAG